MRLIYWIVRFLIPFIVLYTIGYFIPGFSALTVGWIALLTVLIVAIDWFVLRLFGPGVNRLTRIIINFFVSTAVIFTVTLGIQGGNVPLTGALLAAILIALLTVWILPESVKQR